MTDAVQVWKQALPTVLQGVTGRGVWTALNAVQPVILEDGVLVLGIGYREGELAGHLRLAATSRLMESTVSGLVGAPTRVRVIDGSTTDDWEVVKRRDAERRRIHEAEMQKQRTELAAKSSWDTVYEQLSRRWAAVSNKSLPQNRARFFEEAVEIIAEARKSQGQYDELGERNFARCLERLSQYADLPSTLVAMTILKRSGEL